MSCSMWLNCELNFNKSVAFFWNNCTFTTTMYDSMCIHSGIHYYAYFFFLFSPGNLS